MGANGIGLSLAESARRANKEVLFIDTNTDHCNAAQELGFKVIWGSGLDDSVLRRARLQNREGCVGLSPNENVNFAFARRAVREMGVNRVWVALLRDRRQVSREMVTKMGGHVLFAESRNLAFWSLKIERGDVLIERWVGALPDATQFTDAKAISSDRRTYLPLSLTSSKSGFRLVDEALQPKQGDVLEVAVITNSREQAHRELRLLGWEHPEVISGEVPHSA